MVASTLSEVARLAGVSPATASRVLNDSARTPGQEAANPSGEAKRICIFAVNDVMAIGAAAALRSNGLRIPRDAVIAGFDDIETLRDFRPALSTVYLPLEEIGRQATRRAAGTLARDAAPPTITGHVTLRRSTEGVLPPE